jgi:hypothetical protein
MNPLNTDNVPIASTTVGPAGVEGPILYVVISILAIVGVAALAYVAVRAVRTLRGR